MTRNNGTRVSFALILSALCIAGVPTSLRAQDAKSAISSPLTAAAASTLASNDSPGSDAIGARSAIGSASQFDWDNVGFAANPSGTGIPALPLPGSGNSSTGSDADGWKFQLTPYLWLSGIDGTVSVRGQSAPISASFSDVFQNLDLGFMTTFEARKNRFGILLDTSFLNLSTKNSIGQTAATAKFSAKQFMLDPEIYYRVVEHRRGSIDAFTGFRFWHFGNTLRITTGGGNSVQTQRDKNWADPLLGACFKLNLGSGFYAAVKGDVGGFGAGSQLTWQIVAGLGKEIKQKYVFLIGYRRLSVDFESAGLVDDFRFSGLVLGMGIKF